MKREDLVKLGIEDEELQKQIMILHGKDIESHKTSLSEAQAQVEALQGQLTEANTTIESFKELDVDGIKARADEWKTQAEQAKNQAEEQINQLKFDHALEGALAAAKAKNPKAVQALLNLEDLKLSQEDGSIVGLEKQLEAIKSENDYLFETDEKVPEIVTGAQGKKVQFDSFEAALRKGAGLPEK